MVVDDLIDNLTLMQCVLDLAGYLVSTVTTGTAAIATVQRAPPCLILLDVMMPDLSGIEVTRQLRQEQELPLIPILLLTADHEITLEQALEIGANGVLHKPLDLDEVLSKVEAYCRFNEQAFNRD
nr:response regulator [Leptolyngbya sp. FACHB-8]